MVGIHISTLGGLGALQHTNGAYDCKLAKNTYVVRGMTYYLVVCCGFVDVAFCVFLAYAYLLDTRVMTILSIPFFIVLSTTFAIYF